MYDGGLRLAVVILVAGCGRFGFEAATATPGDAAIDTGDTANACGDSVLVAPEQCDLGDVANGDGCNASCEIEPGFLCSETGCARAGGTTATAGATLAPVGGNGGTPFARECQAGSVLVGFTAGIVDTNLTRMVAACAPLTFGFDGQAELGAEVFTDPEGTALANGGEGAAFCPAGSVVTGYSGESTNAQFVRGIALSCRTLAQLGGELVFGPAVQSDVIGSLGIATMPKSCEPGSVARAWIGRADNVIDQMTLRCDPIVASPCGNAVLDAGEACDDGNMVNGDGCSALCVVE